MKEEIMKRGMFAGPMSPETMNSGIMAGFSDAGDMEGEDGEEEEGPENGESEDMGEEMSPMARTPQNPEILMNTLRGDMRSVDARYMELAQMVGQEAADQTPPEVLAMLMGQMGQQAGIGALPQAEAMQPPPMPGEAPMGAGAPQMPPPGMEGMPPFPQGGAEEAPPTPDGMPPQMAAIGGLMSAGQRLAQYGARGAEAVGRGATAANQYLGNLLMSAQPTMQRMVGPDGRPLTVQGRETLLQSPAGLITQGAGTRLAPYTSMGPLTTPTLTQGIGTAMAQGAERFPRAAQALRTMFPVAGLAAGAAQSIGGRQEVSPADAAEQERMQGLLGQIPTTGYPTAAAEQERMQNLLGQIPTTGYPPAPMRPGEPPRPAAQAPTPLAMPPSMAAPTPIAEVVPEAEVAAPVAAAPVGTADFIKTALKEKSKIERIKEAQKEYAPLFKELIGDDTESTKTNALLLLAEAGFKLAGSTKPTFAMALGEAAGGIPRGFAALMAQAKDREVKINTATLQQAITDIEGQDKAAQAFKMAVLKGDYDLLKERAKQGGVVIEDGGAGARLSKTKGGSFLGVSIDPNDPTVKSAVSSRFTLRDTDNPFVENRGQAPTSVETDKAERIKLTSTLRSLDNSLSTLDNLKGTYTGAYSPGTWFTDKVNNLIVPVSGGLVRPDVNVADAASRINTGLNSILKNIASANDSGRVAVQEQEWVRENAKGISNPTGFFQNKELAAKGFASTEAMLRNARQQVLTQLGYEGNDFVMQTPNTGTQSDPFTISADPADQQRMFTFLGSTIGKLQDPKATVYLKMPDGRVDAFNPTQLRGLLPK